MFWICRWADDFHISDNKKYFCTKYVWIECEARKKHFFFWIKEVWLLVNIIHLYNICLVPERSCCSRYCCGMLERIRYAFFRYFVWINEMNKNDYFLIRSNTVWHLAHKHRKMQVFFVKSSMVKRFVCFFVHNSLVHKYKYFRQIDVNIKVKKIHSA